MGKHIADRPRHEDDEDGRVKHYTDIERKSGDEPSKAAKALHRQEKERDNEGRMKRYLDMDRKKED